MSGLEQRFNVEKIEDPEGKHASCRFFVLDLDHDKTARSALHYYAVTTENEALAQDLLDLLYNEFGSGKVSGDAD